MRPAETRLRPPIVPTHRSPVRLSSASESTAWWARPSAGRRIFHAPFSYRPSPFSVPAQMRIPSTRTQKTWLSGRPLAVVKFSQRKRGMSWAVARETAITAASAADKILGVRLELRAANIDLLSQQGATTTAVRIVTVHTLSFHNWRVLLQCHKSLMAGGTDLFLRPCQSQRGHVAFGLRQMADSARKQHGGMHRLTSGFIRVTGGTIGIPRDDARVLDGGCLHCQHQYQQKGTELYKQDSRIRIHNVFKYSIRSFSSSFVRSLLTPCVSFGLNTVQISSSDCAEPSCR